MLILHSKVHKFLDVTRYFAFNLLIFYVSLSRNGQLTESHEFKKYSHIFTKCKLILKFTGHFKVSLTSE
jgi:hypothetical protein